MPETTVNYKCPHCGAPLTFMPGKSTVTCQFCNTEFDAATIDEFFRDKNARAARWTGDELNLQAFTCSSCGAELVCDENTMATECVYCGNPTMIPKRFTGMLMPDYVIPFKKTKADAVAALKEFYKGKKLLPSDFTANNRIEAIQAMYVPFWLFDADVKAQVDFRAAKVRQSNKSEHKKIFSCRRTGKLRFERIPADGSKKMDDDFMDSIEPFDFGELVPFSAAYFAGYLADKFDVDAGECKARVVERIDNSTMEELEKTVEDYQEVSVEASDIEKHFNNVSYAMVPVWILTTRYKDKPYTFMMNGQTGKVVGALPYDFAKSILWPTLYTLAALPFAYIVALIIICLV